MKGRKRYDLDIIIFVDGKRRNGIVGIILLWYEEEYLDR